MTYGLILILVLQSKMYIVDDGFLSIEECETVREEIIDRNAMKNVLWSCGRRYTL